MRNDAIDSSNRSGCSTVKQTLIDLLLWTGCKFAFELDEANPVSALCSNWHAVTSFDPRQTSATTTGFLPYKDKTYERLLTSSVNAPDGRGGLAGNSRSRKKRC
jgi:hypothetical protein